MRTLWFTLFVLLSLAAPLAAAEPPDTLYTLPYPSGQEYLVSVAYNDWPTHVGNYAIDWLMDEGTHILAARDGVVARVVNTFTEAGLTPDFLQKNNLLTLKHPDGTYTDYVHLQKGGIKVRVGQSVKAGELIALSGNTGFSSAPHLHFIAYRLGKNGAQESFPVRFVSGMAKPYEIFRDCRYLAPGPDCQPTVDPFEAAFPGELAKLKFKLADMARAQVSPRAGALAVRDHLKAHGAEYKQKYRVIYAAAQEGDSESLRLLTAFASSMDLRTDPNIDRLFQDSAAAPIAEEALELWNEIQVIE
ncbi:MAG TPA: M23 family metallopeptidase [Candidatus Ozemobacteraceae bacterium]|nr:M23 family metallopeptidase [Candidatus Ozemobacteraceae bacterium]